RFLVVARGAEDFLPGDRDLQLAAESGAELVIPRPGDVDVPRPGGAALRRRQRRVRGLLLTQGQDDARLQADDLALAVAVDGNQARTQVFNVGALGTGGRNPNEEGARGQGGPCEASARANHVGS